MSTDDPLDPKKDPIIQAQIKRALKPYLHVATPAVLQGMRESLEELLTTHPAAVGMIAHLRSRAAPATSREESPEGEEGKDKKSGEPGSDETP